MSTATAKKTKQKNPKKKQKNNVRGWENFCDGKTLIFPWRRAFGKSLNQWDHWRKATALQNNYQASLGLLQGKQEAQQLLFYDSPDNRADCK